MATYPQLNPGPVVEFDAEGKQVTANPAARRLFPTLEEEGSRHPFMKEAMPHLFELAQEKKDRVVREVTLDGITYAQAIVAVPDSNLFRIYGTDITELKRAEALLREREAQLEDAQRVANVGSWHWEVAADKLFWSDQMYRIGGYTIGEPPPNYQEHLKMYAPESIERLNRAVQDIMKDGTPYALELNIIRPQATSRWIVARGEVERDARGKVIALKGTALDITERKELEEELKRRNRALVVLSSGNRVLIHAKSEEGLLKDMCDIVVEKGKYLMAWIGYAEQDERKTVRVAASAGYDEGYLKKIDVVWSDTERGRGPTGTCIRTGEVVIAKDLVTQPNYEPWRANALKRGYASSIALPLRAGGRMIGALTIYAHEPSAFATEELSLWQEFVDDLAFGISTLRLRVEHEKAEEQLDRDAKEIEDLYQHAPCGYHSLAEDGTLIRMNDTELGLFGYAREEVVGKKKFTDLITPESIDVFKKTFPLFKKRGFVKDVTYDAIRKDGTTFPISVTAVSVVDEKGKYMYSRGIVLDISERRKVEQKSEAVDQLKSKFIQIVSHQLRTPLNVIRWNLERLLNRESGQSVSVQQEEALRSTYAADIQVISRVNDLLIAMDIEEKRLSLDKDHVSLDEVIRSTIEEKLRPCEWKHIKYQIHAPTMAMPSAFVDGNKIRDVIARLIDNAITYTPEGGSIAVTYGMEESGLHFEITDTGIGIPTFEQPRIFERFHRGWNAATMKPDASGLSLYISKHIIESHGGKMGFTSVEKKGSTFWFELPVSA